MRGNVMVPGAVRTVSIDYTAGNDHAVLSFSAPLFTGRTPITGYLLARDDGGGVEAAPWSDVYPADTRSLDFLYLKTGTYHFTVTPINARGQGPTASVTVNVSVVSGPAVPAQAAAVGYSTLLFEDDFDAPTSIDMNSTGEAGYKWYVDRMVGWSTIKPGELAVNNSVLTITQTDTSGVNYAICTNSSVSNNGQAFKYFYAEARMRFVPNDGWPNIGGPSFWSLSTDDVWAYDAENTVPHWAELDFYEYVPGAYNGSVHDWLHPDPAQPKIDYVNSNTNYATLPGVDFSTWHTYGCLWTPGTIKYYFDGNHILTTNYAADTVPPEHPNYPIGTWSQLDKETNGMTIVLGSGNNWPLDVDWVRVWGQPSSLLSFTGCSPNPTLPLTATFELDDNHFMPIAGATVSRTTSQYDTGTASLQLLHSTDTNSSATCEISRGLTPGAAFRATCRAKGIVGQSDIRLILHFFTADRTYLSNVSATVTPTGAWQTITANGSLPATVGIVSATVDKPGYSTNVSTVYIDNLTISYV